MRSLPSPEELKKMCPMLEIHKQNIKNFRWQSIEILERKDTRLASIVGPCSIHNVEEALIYAKRIKELSHLVKDSLFLVMRVFVEKPRTLGGWKGLAYDPHLDSSYDVAEGLLRTRRLLLQLAEMGIPCATEFLDPLLASYYDDLISWGFIGARTSASQPHRQIASSLTFPIGFKNSILGELDPAFYGVLSAKQKHTYVGINEQGTISVKTSLGNPHAHLVLRGSCFGSNFDALSVEQACQVLAKNSLPRHLLIDCSHDNSFKNSRNQEKVLNSIRSQRNTPSCPIIGFMLESQLLAGKQPHQNRQDLLQYGISITDDCLGWDETEDLLANFLLVEQ